MKMNEEKNIRLDDKELDEWQNTDTAESRQEQKYKRMAADFSNYKKRVESERSQVQQRIEDRLLTETLDIYDDFLRIVEHTKEQPQEVIQSEGLHAVQNKWQQWLDKYQIEAIDPGGETFDHELHDAVSFYPVSSAEKHNQVIQVVQRGYRRSDRILRHAKVVVGRYAESERQE